ncbi:hypothetical protein AMS68_004423 [Peltaster fructicola]|uniref:DNA polymerase V n=1 Tax=Peltaster fructicola TaxID=286661 RepID=A0A6H0XW47_9PEZI|nr:hypothetical protein AMS68_004423 [Peltaster fructicola]
MGGHKRQLEDGSTNAASHKRRKEYSQNDIALAKIYNDLAEEVEEVRLKAASELIKHLTADAADQESSIDKALTRLIKGVSSSRKAARLGFSIALSEALRIALQKSQSLQQITNRIVNLTTLEGNVSGQEKRDASLGRQFAFQAMLQTGSKTITKVSSEEWRTFLDAVADLAGQRQWLRKQCGLMLYDFISSTDSKYLDDERIQALADAWSAKSLWKTPEGVALWLALVQSDRVTLPKHVWHHQNPLSSKERTILSKVMQEVSTEDDDTQQKGGTRQIVPSFAWTVVLNALLSKDSTKDFNLFWESTVSHGLFATTSSNERKALGLQVVTLALRLANGAALEHVISPEIVRCIVNHRSNADRYLFEGTKAPLNALLARSKLEPSVTARLLAPIWQHGGVNFDQITKTKTVETLLAQADAAALQEVQSLAQQLILKPKTNETTQAETRRRTMADLLISALRSRRQESDLFVKQSGYDQLAPWLSQFIKTLLMVGYNKEADELYDPHPTETTRSVFKTRLTSCLGHLLTFRIELAALGPSLVLSELQSQKALQRTKKSEQDIMKQAGKVLKAISNGAVQDVSNDLTASYALHLLLSMTVLLVYGDEPDSVSALSDLLMSIESWSSSVESKTVFVEIIISFISRPSTIYKKLAEQVFGAFAASMTSDSLRSMLDILEQKESASGQQELFDQQGDAQQDEASDESSDNEAVDVEDDSDVEIVNGLVTTEDDSESSDSDTENTSDGDEDGDEDEDEEAAFDRKLADALGTAAVAEDEDDDGSDMDDEQMMALEPHLATIFKERQKQSTAKQDNKDARENIINFKNRILDLLGIYVKTQYSSVNAVELIHPLIVLIRTTTSKPTAEKAFAVLKQYFDAYNKHKADSPTNDHEILFALLSVIHSEVTEGGSKLHTNACSRSSLFVAKLLVSVDTTHYVAIAEKYAKLQSEWYQDTKSKIQPSMFTEWTSWSITTRKH